MATRKIGIASEVMVQGAMEEFIKGIMSYTRGAKFGSIEIKCRNQEIATINAARQSKTEKWIRFPTDLGKRIVRVSVGRVSLEIETERLAATVLHRTSKDTAIVRRFGLVLSLTISWVGI